MITILDMLQSYILKFFKLNLTYEERVASYDLIENFIAKEVKDWDTSPDTDDIAEKFASHIRGKTDYELAFLLLHSGYIPEFYAHDSSPETLYTKLIEVLVCEWAIRIGFKESFLQKQKSNKEDITIKLGKQVIVCDAKTFRLGRSQPAPNVKDTIKQAAYVAWLQPYKENPARAGLVTFPSPLDWKKNSEAYKYFTDFTIPIVFLFYEHLAYFLICEELGADSLLKFMESYEAIFPNKSKDKDVYREGIATHLFTEHLEPSFAKYMLLSEQILKERILHTIQRIEEHGKEIKKQILEEIDGLPEAEIREMAIRASYKARFGQTNKQLINIRKFRLH